MTEFRHQGFGVPIPRGMAHSFYKFGLARFADEQDQAMAEAFWGPPLPRGTHQPKEDPVTSTKIMSDTTRARVEKIKTDVFEQTGFRVNTRAILDTLITPGACAWATDKIVAKAEAMQKVDEEDSPYAR